MNAHELTNAARAAVYGLSTRTGARRPRIGRGFLSMIGASMALRRTGTYLRMGRGAARCQLIPWSAIAAVAMQ